jgi:hypothetical protein
MRNTIFMRTAITSLLLLFSLFLVAGCGVSEAILEAEKKINDMIFAVDRCRGTLQQESGEWKNESKAWREGFFQLEKDFDRSGERLLGQTLRQTADYAIAHTGSEFRADIKYLQARLFDTLKAVDRALQDAKKDIQEAKKDRDKSKVRVVFDRLANLKIWDDPTIISFVPNHIQMEWNQSREGSQTRFQISSASRRIEANGWGFEQEHPEDLKITLQAIDKAGKPRPLAKSYHSPTTEYLLQLTLFTEDFQEGDKQLVVACSTSASIRNRFLPIGWPNPPTAVPPTPPPVPPEIVTEVEIRYYTLGDDKDKEDTVSFALLADNKEVAKGSHGANEVWPDWTGPWPAPLKRRHGWPPFYRDFSDAKLRTCAVSLPIEVGKNVPGRLLLSKTGSDQGWEFRIELRAKTNRSNTKEYHTGAWKDFFKKARQSNSWDFIW